MLASILETTTGLFVLGSMVFILAVIFALLYYLYKREHKKLCIWCNEDSGKNEDEFGNPTCIKCENRHFLKAQKIFNCPVCGTEMKNVFGVDGDLLRICPKDHAVFFLPEEAPFASIATTLSEEEELVKVA